MKAWIQNVAWPWITMTLFPQGRSLLVKWWDDLASNPEAHCVTALGTLALYFVVKLAVWVAA